MKDFKSRHAPHLSKKERLDILLHEYDSLRSEMLERHNVVIQVVGFASILVAGTFVVLWEHWLFCLLIVAVVGFFFGYAYWRIDLDVSAAALRLTELEKKINALAGEELLEWETHWGVFSNEFRLRDNKVRLARTTLKDIETGKSLDFEQFTRKLVVWLVPSLIVLLAVGMLFVAPGKSTNTQVFAGSRPWLDTRLSPDRRAAMVLARMTLDEKIQLTHGQLAKSIFPSFPIIYRAPKRSLGGAGFVPGIERFGIPDIQMVDAGSGVTAAGSLESLDLTVLPCGLALAATWNPDLAFKYGTVIGRESRAAGFNMVLGGAINLAREPRGGRVFENRGEDPILAGKMVAPELRAIQKQHVIATVKHFAVNDQETGRFGLSANLDIRSLRESDLLAFEIGIRDSDVGTVMCAYNRVNGIYSCENEFLLNQVLKNEWGFKGWVLSDWGATHSTTRAAWAGLDQELPFEIHYGASLKRAVLEGAVSAARLDDMVHRILRTMFAVGVIDDHLQRQTVSPIKDAHVARSVEEQAAVLLKNANGQLPLSSKTVRSIAVIGSNADVGVLSGGGSSQIMPLGGSAVPTERAHSEYFDPMLLTAKKIWLRSAPLEAIRASAPNALVRFASGTDVKAARDLASRSDVVLLFASQWRSEGLDLPNLSLPDNQDALIDAVATVNPHTVVILETGGAVLMPWLERVSAVLEAWYPGSSGADSIADIIFGRVNPSGKLPISFPKSEADLPHREIKKPASNSNLYDMMVKPFLFHLDPSPPKFDVNYSERLNVGYKWYDAEGKAPLFPFGFGLSYTTFAYSDLKVSYLNDLHVAFSIVNTGKHTGAEVAQVYLEFPSHAGEPPRRLIGWRKITMTPGQHSSVDLTIEPLLFSAFDVNSNAWKIIPGAYKIFVGSSSRDIRLAGEVEIPAVH